jgi:hypothetical protein
MHNSRTSGGGLSGIGPPAVLDITGGRGLAVCDSLRSPHLRWRSRVLVDAVARGESPGADLDVEVLGDTDWEQLERLADVGCVGERLLDRRAVLAEV